MSIPPPVEPLDPTLAAVLSEERGARPSPRGSRERVLARLDASLGGGLLPPGGGGTPAGGSAASGRSPAASGASTNAASSAPVSWLARGLPIATLLAGVAIGAAWSPLGKRPMVVVSAAPPPTTSAAQASDSAPASVPVEALASAPPLASTAPKEVHSATKPVTDESGALAQERVLLDGARTALVRRDGSGALSLLERHRARFPGGALSEEREALAVQALALEGRPGEARTRADAFARRYPSSLFLPAVRAAVGEARGPQ